MKTWRGCGSEEGVGEQSMALLHNPNQLWHARGGPTTRETRAWATRI